MIGNQGNHIGNEARARAELGRVRAAHRRTDEALETERKKLAKLEDRLDKTRDALKSERVRIKEVLGRLSRMKQIEVALDTEEQKNQKMQTRITELEVSLAKKIPVSKRFTTADILMVLQQTDPCFALAHLLNLDLEDARKLLKILN